jgi:hypothetical protein
MMNPNAGLYAQPYAAQQTYVPRQTYMPPQTYQPTQAYVPRQTYVPSQTYMRQQTYYSSNQQLGNAASVKGYTASASPIPTIAPPNYRTSQPSTSYYPLPLKFTVPPPTPDEARIIWKEDPHWSTTAKNPSSSALGLGQLLNSSADPNRNTVAALVSKQVGFYVDPNTTDPSLQLLMMRAYIQWRYARDAARDDITPAAEAFSAIFP